MCVTTYPVCSAMSKAGPQNRYEILIRMQRASAARSRNAETAGVGSHGEAPSACTRGRANVGASTLPRSADVQKTRKKRRTRGRVQLPEVSVEDLSGCRSRTFQNENTTFQRGVKEQRMAKVSNKATSCDQIYLTLWILRQLV